ncbi:MAG: VWA domain-containing protein, partial [Planctomycetes bacterium]|nr:VWA domain-containing protein [Planctomycetota bacterium]
LTASSITSLRVLAVRACGENRFKSGFDKVKNSLNNESWRVQLSAIEALVNYAADPEYTDAAIEAIINFMGRIDGKLVEDCAKALRDITGEDYGTDAEAWRAWFRQKQGNPDKGGAAPSGDSHKKRYRTATFDVDTFSKQLIFVIDASSSMREPVDPDAVEETKKRVITGKKNGDGKDGDKKKADKKEDDIDWSNVKTKLDLAKIELIRTVQALSEDSMFNIVSFSTTVFKPWKPTLTQATQANKEDAAKYIKGLATGDETNIFDSIYTAMEMAEKGYDDAADPKKKGPVTGKKEVTACDTIYFITDGYATAGKYQGPKLTGPATDEQKKYYGGEMDAMIKELAHRNQVAKITLHTVGVGPGHDTRTLPNLAKAMGGNYKAIGMGLAKK